MKNNKNKQLNSQKKIRIFLRVLLLLIICANGFLFYIKKKMFSYNLKYIEEIINTISTADVKYYNMSGTFEENINNNKITVINIIFNNRHDIFSNLQKNNILIDSFGDKINIIDILIDRNIDVDNNKNDNIFDNLFDKILDNNLENIIKSNNISNVVVEINKLNLNDKNIITKNIGNILILDEKNNLKNIFTKETNISQIKKKIVDISMKRKFLKRRDIKSSEYYKTNDNDEQLIGEFKNFILIENNKDYDYPFFVILDSRQKHLFLTTINGEIFKMINLNSFCYPNNLKFYEDKLYISDMCSGSISYIDSFKEENGIKTLIQNENLLNLIDFEFIDDNNIFVVKNDKNSQIIYNIQEKTIENINYETEIGYITNLVKYDNKIYFFDVSSNVLYYYDINENNIKVKLNLYSNDSNNFNISYFTMNNDKNVYFLSKDLNKIYMYSDSKIQELNFKNFLNYPKDLEIFRNYFYFLSDNYLQRINFLTRDNENIQLSFSKHFTFNLIDVIKYYNINGDYTITKKISTDNNKINFIYNNMEFLSNSPSFLLLFKQENNKLKLVNRLPFNKINSNEDIDIDYNFDLNSKYLLYGKIYYRDLEDNIDKIKTISISLKVNKTKSKDNVVNIIF